MHTKLFNWVKELLVEVYQLSWALFKIMIPVLLIVKVLEELGAIDLLTLVVAPVMAMVGLPQEAGLVLATTMLTNLYGGMIIYFSMAGEMSLSVAQVTVMGAMMLMAHSLPIEIRVSQKAGVRPLYLLTVRILGGFFLGWILSESYTAAHLLQQPVELFWKPELVDNSWFGWLLDQAKSLLMVVLIITVLIALLKLFRLVGIEKLFIWLLQPVMRMLGMSKQATTIVIVGMTLGLTFGAGLLIKEANSGKLSAKDLFSSLSLLALCHSIIEDTILVMLLGADITGVLWARILFSLVVVIALGRLYERLGRGFQSRYLVSNHNF